MLDCFEYLASYKEPDMRVYIVILATFNGVTLAQSSLTLP